MVSVRNYTAEQKKWIRPNEIRQQEGGLTDRLVELEMEGSATGKPYWWEFERSGLDFRGSGHKCWRGRWGFTAGNKRFLYSGDPTIILPVDLPLLPLNSLKELALSKQTCFNYAPRRLVVIVVFKRKEKKFTTSQQGWLYQGDNIEKRSKSKPRTNEFALKGLLDDISKLGNEFHDWRLFGSDAQDTRDVNTRVWLRPYVQQK